MRPGPTAVIAAIGADPDSSQERPFEPRPRWKRFAALGLAAYLAALVIMLPARFVVDWGPRWQIAGTAWNGEAVLDSAYRLTWRWAPLRSLAAFAFAADVRFDGDGTDIAGSVIASGRRLRFDGLSGRGDGALLTALDPTLPFHCDLGLEVSLPRLIIDGPRSSAEGDVRTGSGTCTGSGAAIGTAAAPMLATLRLDPDGTTRGRLAPIEHGRLALAQGSIANGRLTIMLTPVGRAAMPFATGFGVNEIL